MSGDTLPGTPGGGDEEELTARARSVLEAHWRPPGFCVPNAGTYPWQWLWDSCFHAVCWAHLGRPERALRELTSAFGHQSVDGFVPHMTYWDGDTRHAGFWGRRDTSCLTQPPMYGHAVAELLGLGVDVPSDLVERARRGLGFLIETRSRSGGAVVAVHPWESGCDDSPRWDAWAEPDSWSYPRWKERKGELVQALRFDPATGSPCASEQFEVASAGFNALVAFNAGELARAIGDAGLSAAASRLVGWLSSRWEPDLATWADEVVVGPATTARVRTLDALLPVLVGDDPIAIEAAFAEIRDGHAFGGRFGPAAVHRAEPMFDLAGYWRGPAWPHLTYLLWLAARRQGRLDDAQWLALHLHDGARRSRLAEYWHPDTGAGMGAIPQSWSALAAVVSAERTRD